MRTKPLKWIVMTIFAAAFFAAAGACFGEGILDLPDLKHAPASRIPAERLVPPQTDTASLADTRHAAMLDATRGTKAGLVGGRVDTLEPVSLTNPEDAAKRLEPPKKPELVPGPPIETVKPELKLEALNDDRKAR